MKAILKGHRSRSIIYSVLFLCIITTGVNAQKSKKKSKSGAQMEMQTPASGLSKDKIEAALNEAYDKFKDLKEGKNADYIKELANVDPNIFGIALITADGQVYTRGDITSMVSIQSLSKVFTMAKVLEELGPNAIQDKIGVDATGMR